MSINNNIDTGIKVDSLFSQETISDSTAFSYYNDNKNLTNVKYKQHMSENEVKGSFSNYIPIDNVMAELMSTRIDISKVMKEIEIFLSNVYLKADLVPSLDIAHNQVWNEVVNKAETKNDDVISISNIRPENYISYQEYAYCQKHQCRGCRALIMEYDALVGKTALSYYYDIKNIIKLFSFELECIYRFMISMIGDDYNNETEKDIAKEFYFWSKTLKEYTKLFAKEIMSIPPKLPKSQMDNLSKIQATQFETFFSFKINSYQSEIKKLTGLLKTEMQDTSEMYYQKFLGPALQARSYVAFPLEVDLLSSDIKNKSPELAKEIVMAASSINGNIASLIADLQQKRVNSEKRIIGALETIRLKRKYISYVSQLQSISEIKSQSIYVDLDSDKYSEYFEEASIFGEKNETLNSSHKYFNNLLEDDHPQYLLRSGGTIVGDIHIKDGAKIAGLDIANHTHSNMDGSKSIKISDIDYETDRSSDTASLYLNRLEKEPVTISVDSYSQDVLIGGVPVIDVLLNAEINVDTSKEGKYDIIISYIELED